MYTGLLTSNLCTLGCVHKSKYFWSFPHPSLKILTLGLPYPFRSIEFNPPLPFEVLYKEPVGYIEEGELKSKETIVHCCLNFSYT